MADYLNRLIKTDNLCERAGLVRLSLFAEHKLILA